MSSSRDDVLHTGTFVTLGLQPLRFVAAVCVPRDFGYEEHSDVVMHLFGLGFASAAADAVADACGVCRVRESLCR